MATKDPPTYTTMSPQSLIEYMQRHNIESNVQLSRMTGTNRDTIGAYKEGKYPIPLLFALALSALAKGLPPQK